MQDNKKVERFIVFRMDQDAGLYGEMKEGRLRQGWGASGLALRRKDSSWVDKAQWVEKHREIGWGDPSPLRFAILRRMLDLDQGDIVVIPKMPQSGQFSIARVSGEYQFEEDRFQEDRGDFGHIIPIDPDSVRTFDYRANDDAFLVSGLFARANHRPRMSFCTVSEHVDSACRLFEEESSLTTKSLSELSQTAVDQAFNEAAKSLQKQVENWNGHRFEGAVQQAFREQGYEVNKHRHYDGCGGDVDILVSPPARHGLFQPENIAVQVKWKQGIDVNDKHAVDQLIMWKESQKSEATIYCVISSASGFTEETQRFAAENEIVLIGGLQTMCFLLGVPERFRVDWERDA